MLASLISSNHQLRSDDRTVALSASLSTRSSSKHVGRQPGRQKGRRDIEWNTVTLRAISYSRSARSLDWAAILLRPAAKRRINHRLRLRSATSSRGCHRRTQPRLRLKRSSHLNIAGHREQHDKCLATRCFLKAQRLAIGQFSIGEIDEFRQI